MVIPPLTPQLARRIEQNDVDYSISRLEGMRLSPGNPLGIEIRRFGQSTALLIRGWPEFWYGNKVVGLQPADEQHLAATVGFYQQAKLTFRFEIMPGNLNTSLATALHHLGFSQMGFSTAMYGTPGELRDGTPPSGEIRVRRIDLDEAELFLQVYQDGFGLPRLAQAELRVVKTWLESAPGNLRLYLAQVGDYPAGIGILDIKGSIGLLADATTLREYRGRGCHAALVAARIADASRSGCELLTSFVEFGSGSHRNLERAGLRVAYTKALWWAVE